LFLLFDICWLGPGLPFSQKCPPEKKLPFKSKYLVLALEMQYAGYLNDILLFVHE